MLHPDRVKVSVNKSLADLGTDYLDLLLVHVGWTLRDEALDIVLTSNTADRFSQWPFSIRVPSDKNPYDPTQIKAEYLDPSVNLIDVWRVFESLVDAKIVRTIGVSNMSVRMLKEFLPQCRIKPAVNQVGRGALMDVGKTANDGLDDRSNSTRTSHNTSSWPTVNPSGSYVQPTDRSARISRRN